MLSKLHYCLVISFILCTSGCSRPDCTDLYTIDKILFYRSDLDELNSLKIEGYKQGSDFEKMVDNSFNIVSYEEIGSEYYGHLNKPIRTDLDYLFLFSQTDRFCKITNIQVREQLCYNGLLYKDYIRSFDGYYVDTLRFACQILKVFPTN